MAKDAYDKSNDEFILDAMVEGVRATVAKHTGDMLQGSFHSGSYTVARINSLEQLHHAAASLLEMIENEFAAKPEDDDGSTGD